MAQQLFNTSSTGTAAHLDANFSDLYDLREQIDTPAYASSAPLVWLDATGSWRLGAAPSAWTSPAYQVKALGLWSNGVLSDLMNNLYFDGTNTRYVVTSAGGVFQMASDGSFNWQSTPSGTAGAVATMTTLLKLDASGNLTPGADNTQTCGSASKRWSTVYAGTGTINTSDAREKSAVVPLTTNELAAAKALAAIIGTYQWSGAMQIKGADARTHIGLTVQDAMAIMTANGLDPMAYGFICHDSWDAETDPNGNTTQAGDRYGFRTDELLLFLARSFDARLTAAGF